MYVLRTRGLSGIAEKPATEFLQDCRGPQNLVDPHIVGAAVAPESRDDVVAEHDQFVDCSLAALAFGLLLIVGCGGGSHFTVENHLPTPPKLTTASLSRSRRDNRPRSSRRSPTAPGTTDLRTSVGPSVRSHSVRALPHSERRRLPHSTASQLGPRESNSTEPERLELCSCFRSD